jgi:hypothetical protein
MVAQTENVGRVEARTGGPLLETHRFPRHSKEIRFTLASAGQYDLACPIVADLLTVASATDNQQQLLRSRLPATSLYRWALGALFVKSYRFLGCSSERFTTPDAQHCLGCVQQCLIIQSCVGGRQSFQAVDHLPELIIWLPTCDLKRFYHCRIVRVHIPMTQHVAPICFRFTS